MKFYILHKYVPALCLTVFIVIVYFLIYFYRLKKRKDGNIEDFWTTIFYIFMSYLLSIFVISTLQSKFRIFATEVKTEELPNYIQVEQSSNHLYFSGKTSEDLYPNFKEANIKQTTTYGSYKRPGSIKYKTGFIITSDIDVIERKHKKQVAHDFVIVKDMGSEYLIRSERSDRVYYIDKELLKSLMVK